MNRYNQGDIHVSKKQITYQMFFFLFRSFPKPSKLNRLKYAGYSAEFLDRVEPNGNILNKDAPGNHN